MKQKKMKNTLRNTKDYIPIDMLVDGHLYEVRSRAIAGGQGIARYVGKNEGGLAKFLSPSVTMGEEYLEEEYHWDSCKKHGTVKPLRYIGAVPKAFDGKRLHMLLRFVKPKSEICYDLIDG